MKAEDFFISLPVYRTVDILLNHRLQSLSFMVGVLPIRDLVQQSPIQI